MTPEYLPAEDHPNDLTISTYWKPGTGMMYLREGLPANHAENQWNWFRRTYPDYNPNLYGIQHPFYSRFENMTREELINKVAELEGILKNLE